jgi:hypothetical protein
MTTRQLRARLERLGVPPTETAPVMSADEQAAHARILDFAFRPIQDGPLTAAEEIELAALVKRFPPDPNDPLNDACAAWRAPPAAVRD